MNSVSPHRLREEMRPFLVRHDWRAYVAVSLDFCLYIGATVLAVLAEPIWLKALSAVMAGAMTSALFVLGHDAAHGGLTSKRWVNRVLGRLVFLPSLHNYTLWLIQHNRVHHRLPNVKRINSWWPLSVEEYNAMRPWRRLVERIYRSGGVGLYYLTERWWKDKFYPGRSVDDDLRRAALWDFALLGVWLVALLGALAWVSSLSGRGSPLDAVLWGFLLPFLVWNCNMGLTVFLQHTKVPRVNGDEPCTAASQTTGAKPIQLRPRGLTTFDYLLKFACTEVSLITFRLQIGAVPEQPPAQLAKVLPAGGVAVRVTMVPDTNFAEHALPQLMPGRSLVTVPGLLRPIDSV
jgi:fatty acid desaturase